MVQDDKITVAQAIVFYEGQIQGVEWWLERFSDGREKRGQMDIDQHLHKLKMFRWTLAQLKRSV